MCLMSCHANISFIKLIFFLYSHSCVHIISNIEAKKKRFRNIRSKIQTYMFSCELTYLIAMYAESKRRRKKECAPKNCSYCEIFCFIKYGLNKKKFEPEFSLVKLITLIKKSYD